MNIAGVILAGGQSRRMSGQEKSLLKLAGREPISWVAERMKPQVSHLAVNANGEANRFNFLKLPVIEDTVQGSVGPLAGVLSGMIWAKTLDQVTHIATAATDTPFLPQDCVSKLTSNIRAEIDISMANSNGRIHPVFTIWPIALADALKNFLIEEDKRKILEFAKRYSLRETIFPCEPHDPFFNINTPEDFKVAEQIAAELMR